MSATPDPLSHVRACRCPECRLGEAHTEATTLRAQRDALAGALQTFIKQWEACGPNSEFGRYFANVYREAKAAIQATEGETR